MWWPPWPSRSHRLALLTGSWHTLQDGLRGRCAPCRFGSGVLFFRSSAMPISLAVIPCQDEVRPVGRLYVPQIFRLRVPESGL